MAIINLRSGDTLDLYRTEGRSGRIHLRKPDGSESVMAFQPNEGDALAFALRAKGAAPLAVIWSMGFNGQTLTASGVALMVAGGQSVTLDDDEWAHAAEALA